MSEMIRVTIRFDPDAVKAAKSLRDQYPTGFGSTFETSTDRSMRVARELLRLVALFGEESSDEPDDSQATERTAPYSNLTK